jgi:hypothetical protein
MSYEEEIGANETSSGTSVLLSRKRLSAYVVVRQLAVTAPSQE